MKRMILIVISIVVLVAVVYYISKQRRAALIKEVAEAYNIDESQINLKPTKEIRTMLDVWQKNKDKGYQGPE